MTFLQQEAFQTKEELKMIWEKSLMKEKIQMLTLKALPESHVR